MIIRKIDLSLNYASIGSLFTLLFLLQCTDNSAKEKLVDEDGTKNYTIEMNSNLDTITLGAGCFWCVEAIFDQLEGVENVVSGYSNGSVKNPTYKEVCTGKTGHAEVCQLSYNPEVIPFKDILEVFFQTHDPTTLNRQGADVGTQYRSGIYYSSESQKAIALQIIDDLNKAHVWPNPIVTEVKPLEMFYPAEDYHQEYFENNGENGYCRAVIQPKVEKFQKVFKDKLK